MEKIENPPAFPGGWPEAGYEPHYGMTLRDHFAGQALGAVIREGNPTRGIGTFFDMMAQDAYRLADAMLLARKEPTQ